MLQKCEGIVLRTTDYGETNKIVTLYTREWGKIGVMARGAKKPKSRLSAITQPFTYGYFLMQKGNGSREPAARRNDHSIASNKRRYIPYCLC